MIRVFFASLGMALLIGLVFSVPGAIVPIFVVLFVLIAAANLGKLKCSHCGKRVKLGASVCHHCGRDVKSYTMRMAEMRRPNPPNSVPTVAVPPPASVTKPVMSNGQPQANRLPLPANYSGHNSMQGHISAQAVEQPRSDCRSVPLLLTIRTSELRRDHLG